jgi:hypothetical protein
LLQPSKSTDADIHFVFFIIVLSRRWDLWCLSAAFEEATT